MNNTQIAKELNELMGKRNKVEIYTNGYDQIVVRGKARGVNKSLEELAYGGLKVIKIIAKPDTKNPYCDGTYAVIVGK